MTRRTLLIAPILLAQDAYDPWGDLARVWNPFAAKLNAGVVDLAAWKKVIRQIERIQGAACR